MGAFSRTASPGLNLICCPFQQMAGVLSTRVQQLNVRTATKTQVRQPRGRGFFAAAERASCRRTT